VQVQYDILIKGRVQGVGFRMYAQKQANDYNITGWVKNMPDESVRVLACGDEADMKMFLDALNSGPPMSNVSEFIKSRIPNPESFIGFKIKY